MCFVRVVVSQQLKSRIQSASTLNLQVVEMRFAGAHPAVDQYKNYNNPSNAVIKRSRFLKSPCLWSDSYFHFVSNALCLICRSSVSASLPAADVTILYTVCA